MRFLVLSDTHGDRTQMVRALDYLEALRADALLHLGDYAADADFLARELRIPARAVSGNCDAFRSMRPTEEAFECEGVRILLTHGHRYGVKEDLQRLTYARARAGVRRRALRAHARALPRPGAGGAPAQPRLPLPAAAWRGGGPCAADGGEGRGKGHAPALCAPEVRNGIFRRLFWENP